MGKVDRMGVLILMTHLIITLTIIIGYIVALIMGKPVANLETAMFMILAYWFGAMGTNAIRPNANTQINQANEVKVNPPAEQQNPPTDRGV